MAARSAGYTLLEMVVVISLIALATALVGPASFRMIQTWRDASDVERVIAELAAVSVRARNEGREWQLLPDDPETVSRAVELPEGWTLQMNSPLLVRANGACNGATAVLATGRQTIPLRVEPPYCRTRRAEDGEGRQDGGP